VTVAVADYEALSDHVAHQNASSLNVLAVLAATLVPIFWVLDWLLMPEHVWLMAGVRAFVTVCSAWVAVLYKTNERWIVDNVGWLAPMFTSMLWASIAIMGFVHNGYESVYYAGICLVVLSSGTLFLWPFKTGALSYTVLYGAYLVPLSFIAVTEFTIVMNNQFFIVSTIIIVTASQRHRFNLEAQRFLGELDLTRTKTSLETAVEDLETAHAELKALQEENLQVANNVTHELRTPLTAILGCLEDMLTGGIGQFDESQLYYLRLIWNNGLTLLGYINKLMKAAKLEEGFLRLHVEKTNLMPLVTDIVEHSSPLAARREIKVDLEVRATVDDLWVDFEQMESVFVNLLSNAFKFSDEGGNVAVLLDAADDEVRVSVTDNGCGIPEDKIDEIFMRFRQADGSVTRRYGGTGIGLDFAQKIVKLHGGQISVTTKLGEGSTFTVHLPRGREHFDPSVLGAQPVAPVIPDRESDEPRAWTNRLLERTDYRFLDIRAATERRIVERGPDTFKATKVLVVEDNVDILRFLHVQLQEAHSVYLAQDGEKGLELAFRESPDVIVTDYMMPNMDGLSMLRALRSDERTADTPVIMLTAKNRLDDRLEAREAGADIYLNKPFSPRELRAAVKTLLEKRGRQATTLMRAHVKGLEIVSAGLAHEIYNPLSRLKSAWMVIDEQTDKMLAGLDRGDTTVAMKARGKLEKMSVVVGNAVERIEQVVQLVRRYAREGYPDEPTPVELDALVRDVLELVGPHEGKVDVALELDAVGCKVSCIPEEMQQVVRNLMQNAVDAAGPGGNVTVRTSGDVGVVNFEVRDDGSGIEKKDLERIFTPFFTTKEAGKGLGLGLAITQHVVEQCGGMIAVESIVGVGTTFRVRLPAQGVHKSISNPEMRTATAESLAPAEGDAERSTVWR